MSAVPKSALLPLEQAFEKRIYSIYSNMVRRFSERRYKSGPRKGVVFRAAIPIPFSLEEFREFALECLGGNRNGSCYCNYCQVPLDAMTIGFDHEHPVSQGGSVGLLNIKPACADCNRLKGKLSPLGFAWLKQVLISEVGKHLTIADSKEIVQRLKSGGGAYKTARSAKAMAAKLKIKEDEEPF